MATGVHCFCFSCSFLLLIDGFFPHVDSFCFCFLFGFRLAKYLDSFWIVSLILLFPGFPKLASYRRHKFRQWASCQGFRTHSHFKASFLQRRPPVTVRDFRSKESHGALTMTLALSHLRSRFLCLSGVASAIQTTDSSL